MPIKQTKKLLSVKPVTLSETAEHKIHTRKWWAIVILVLGGIMLAGRLPVPYTLAYLFLLFGHLGMLHTFFDKRDIPMMVVNAVWVVIDVVGMYRWFH
jgi:hypothetical protein